MKYTCSLLLALLVATFSSGCRATHSAKSDAPSCMVSDVEAIFTFPISSKESYEWNHAPDNELEYECEAVFGKYSLGFTLFKHPESSPASGSINDLLKAGQCNAWASREYMKDVAVTIKYHDSSLVVTLKDNDLIEEIFSQKPTQYKIDIRGFDYDGVSSGKITYQTEF